MAVRIKRNHLYQSSRRWHRDWEAFDDAGAMVTRGRANFPTEPTKGEEDAKFALILASVEAQIAESATAATYEAEKQAYLEREGLDSEEALVKLLVEKNLDTSVVAREVP